MTTSDLAPDELLAVIHAGCEERWRPSTGKCSYPECGCRINTPYLTAREPGVTGDLRPGASHDAK